MTSQAPSPAVASSFDELVARAADLAEADERLLFELIHARKAAQLSQRDVARLLGIKQPSVAGFEAHDSDPKLSTIRRYALAVGAHVEHVVTAKPPVSNPLDAWVGPSTVASMSLWFDISSMPTAEDVPVVPQSAYRSALTLVA